ncbi:PaaI family thioesterase [Congregibacter litoralis]|uniref:Putative domain protein 1 n=1 Tax=Congregibacter litoralis KT71 TaxID=314285 RepID=A4A3G8_9GAMM|nr:PaaI family thioesterase [Congregibacter litoralis]EAQ99241.1 putative domain protein 1 [Congregibacter litoralis KT71]
MPTPRNLDRLNANLPVFMKLFDGKVAEFDVEDGTATLTFTVGENLCHSGDVVQGGFVTAMLDAAMSHAVFGYDDTVANLSSLEISTRYLEATRAGFLTAVGRIVRLSHKTAFLDGQLFNADGHLLATTQSVAKIYRKAKEA